MNRYDARQQFIEGLEQYVAGIETDEGLLRLARNVSAYHAQVPAEAYRLVKAILETRDGVAGSPAARQRPVERTRMAGSYGEVDPAVGACDRHARLGVGLHAGLAGGRGRLQERLGVIERQSAGRRGLAARS